MLFFVIVDGLLFVFVDVGVMFKICFVSMVFCECIFVNFDLFV